MTPEWEHFKSNRTHLIVFPALLAAVSRLETQEVVSGSIANVATHAATAALGPVGLLARLVFEFDEMTEKGPEAPELERLPLSEFVGMSAPTAMVQGQVPRELLNSGRWPLVEWFRPVYVFPRGVIQEIRVKWTSSVLWRTSENGRWTTEINFWSAPRLRRVLASWAYPLA